MILTWQNPLSGFLEWLMMLALPASGSMVRQQEDSRPHLEADQVLMLRLRNGDRDAFTVLFEKWKRPLISYFYRSVGDYHLAEDLALETAAKVYRARERYQPRARFSTWLFQIAGNHLRDSWRRKRNAVKIADGTGNLPEWEYPGHPNPLDRQAARIWEEWLLDALEKIPLPEKTALLLVAQQGMTPSEAADVMKLTPNHVRVLLNKARNRLKEFREETS